MSCRSNENGGDEGTLGFLDTKLPRRVEPDARVLVLIPAFNEAPHIGRVLEELRHSSSTLHAVVIDDGSTDATSHVARAMGATVIRHPFNLGYGAALQTGYKFALASNAGMVVQMDADGQHDPSQIAGLIEPVALGHLDLVIGSRFQVPHQYPVNVVQKAGVALLRAFAQVYGFALTDPMSGFQVMNRRVLSYYTRDTFPKDYPDLETLIQTSRQGLEIGERPARMRPNLRSSRLHSGFAPLYYLYRTLLSLLVASPFGRKQVPAFRAGDQIQEPS